MVDLFYLVYDIFIAVLQAAKYAFLCVLVGAIAYITVDTLVTVINWLSGVVGGIGG